MNHREYLLGLLDDSCTPSHEGIGMAIARLEALERVAEAAKLLRNTYNIRDNALSGLSLEMLFIYSEELDDALAALEGEKK